MVEPASGALAVALTPVAAEKLLDLLASGVKSAAFQLALRNQRQAALENLNRQSRRYRMVKTLWCMREPIDYRQFYTKTFIEIAKASKVVQKRGPKSQVEKCLEVTKLADIFDGKPILITGGAGQGKSILARHLAVREMEMGDRFPILIELHKLQTQTIEKAMLSELECLGLPPTEDSLAHLASSKKICLIVDGFDELPHARRGDVVHSLERLNRTFSLDAIVMTSRPGSDAEKAPLFVVRRILPTRFEDVPKILHNICESDVAESAYEALSRNEMTHIRELLVTPLMVVLFALRFQREMRPPAQRIDFYGGLFDTIAFDHDDLKVGFQRERNSGLSRRELEKVLDGIAFRSRAAQLSSIPRENMESIASDAVESVSPGTDSQLALTDLCSCSGLLVRDGDVYGFAHKTIQEFHSAQFVSSQSPSFFQKFMEKSCDNFVWEPEMSFLTEIEPEQTKKLFWIPRMGAFLGEFANTPPSVDALDKLGAWMDRFPFRLFVGTRSASGEMELMLDPVRSANVYSWPFWDDVFLVLSTVLSRTSAQDFLDHCGVGKLVHIPGIVVISRLGPEGTSDLIGMVSEMIARYHSWKDEVARYESSDLLLLD